MAATAGTIAASIEACTQYSNTVRKRPGNPNPSFDISSVDSGNGVRTLAWMKVLYSVYETLKTKVFEMAPVWTGSFWFVI